MCVAEKREGRGTEKDQDAEQRSTADDGKGCCVCTVSYVTLVLHALSYRPIWHRTLAQLFGIETISKSSIAPDVSVERRHGGEQEKGETGRKTQEREGL